MMSEASFDHVVPVADFVGKPSHFIASVTLILKVKFKFSSQW